jgi:Tfp pilus assembly protein PilX
VKTFCYARKERGATLLVALIMMLLLTLMVSGSFSLSTINLKAVGNNQVRKEALASANAAVAQVIGTPFTDNPGAAASDLRFDIDNNNVNDYVVSIGVPECIRATQSSTVALSSATLVMPSSNWNTVWMIEAAVNDAATGAQTVVRSAVRVLLSDSEKTRVCP